MKFEINSFGIDLFNRSIESFNLPKLFSGKNVHEKFILFNKTILNIFHNFIPNKVIVCDGKDPLRMNDELKSLIKRKMWLYQTQRKSGKLGYAKLKTTTTDISFFSFYIHLGFISGDYCREFTSAHR